MSLQAMSKAAGNLIDYLMRRDSKPLSLAAHIAYLPDEQREAVYEFCVAFLQEIVNTDAYTPMMRNYRGIAKKMLSNL